jgi:hypothetical protein
LRAIKKQGNSGKQGYFPKRESDNPCRKHAMAQGALGAGLTRVVLSISSDGTRLAVV